MKAKFSIAFLKKFAYNLRIFIIRKRKCTVKIFYFQGTPPKAPVVSMLRPPHGLLSVNATSIDLNLAAWGSGGCDISSFVIEFIYFCINLKRICIVISFYF